MYFVLKFSCDPMAENPPEQRNRGFWNRGFDSEQQLKLKKTEKRWCQQKFYLFPPLSTSKKYSYFIFLSCVGIRIVFVHGGGPEINHWLTRLLIQPTFLNGLHVTDASTMERVSMVLIGKVNKHLVSLINKAGAVVPQPSAYPAPNSAQLGFVGDIAKVDRSVLFPLVNNSNHIIPVIASMAADEKGQSYKINAYTAAGELAAALGAEKLILLTDVAGILEDREDVGSLVEEIDVKGVKRMVEEGKIAGGMIPKANCYVRAITQGVRTASIINGRVPHSLLLCAIRTASIINGRAADGASIIDGQVPHSLLLEILTDQGAGTMITG